MYRFQHFFSLSLSTLIVFFGGGGGGGGGELVCAICDILLVKRYEENEIFIFNDKSCNTFACFHPFLGACMKSLLVYLPVHQQTLKVSWKAVS